ncbi:MAG: WD40 repeat domain-containing protein, partial [Thermoguttaceae bacterium]|nr:WD40 repeat domain-containing protein [Thermoguttaceae bacterium]
MDPTKKISLPVGPTETAEVVFPTRPSRFVAIGSNRGADDYREVWNLETLQAGERIGGQWKRAELVALSPDGRHLAVYGRQETRFTEGQIAVFSAETAKQVALFPVTAAHRAHYLDIAASGQVVLVRDSMGRTEASVWNLKDRQLARRFTLGTGMCRREQLALSPGGRYLALVGGDLRVCEIANGQTVIDAAVPRAPGWGPGQVRATAFSPDGRHLAFLVEDGAAWRAYCWDLTAQGPPEVKRIGSQWAQRLRAVEPNCHEPRLEWMPDGIGWLAFGAVVLDRQTGEGIWEFPKAARQKSPRRLLDSTRLLSVTRKESGRVLECIEVPHEKLRKAADVVRQGGDLIDVALGPLARLDRSSQKSAGLAGGQAPAWSVKPDPAPPPERKYSDQPLPIAGLVKQVCFSSPASGQAVVLAIPNPHAESAGAVTAELLAGFERLPGRLERFDLFAGKRLGRIDLPCPGDLLDVSPSGRRALLRFGGQRIDVWSLDEGKPLCGLRPWTPPKDATLVPPIWARFVDDDRIVSLAGSPGELTLWEIPACRAVYAYPAATVWSAALSPGRNYIALRDEGRIVMVEAATGEVQGVLPFPQGSVLGAWEPGAAAFSLDGTRFAAAWRGETISDLVAWDLSTGALIADAHDVAPGQTLQWHGPGHLLVTQTGTSYLVDLKRHAVVWRYQYTGGWPVAAPPDQRQWVVVQSPLRRTACLAAHTAVNQQVFRTVDAQVPGDQPPLWGPGTPITLDTSGLNVSSPDLRARLEAALHRAPRPAPPPGAPG